MGGGERREEKVPVAVQEAGTDEVAHRALNRVAAEGAVGRLGQLQHEFVDLDLLRLVAEEGEDLRLHRQLVGFVAHGSSAASRGRDVVLERAGEAGDPGTVAVGEAGLRRQPRLAGEAADEVRVGIAEAAEHLSERRLAPRFV